jgi:hypothetical protein
MILYAHMCVLILYIVRYIICVYYLLFCCFRSAVLKLPRHGRRIVHDLRGVLMYSKYV